jgi:hypothetical protein
VPPPLRSLLRLRLWLRLRLRLRRGLPWLVLLGCLLVSSPHRLLPRLRLLRLLLLLLLLLCLLQQFLLLLRCQVVDQKELPALHLVDLQCWRWCPRFCRLLLLP